MQCFCVSDKSFCKEEFLKDLEINLRQNISAEYSAFYAVLSRVLEKHAPFKQRTIRGNNKQHCHKNLRKAMMTRSTLKNKSNKSGKTEDFEKYKKQRNLVFKINRKAKFDFYRSIEPRSIANDKTVWKAVKPMFSNRNPMGEKIVLIEDEVIISDDAMIAECFNSHFVNITDSLGLDPIFKQAPNCIELDEKVEVGLMKYTNHPSMKNIYRYCQTRANKGRAPTLTSSGTNKSVKKHWSGWTKGKEKPYSDTEIKRMVALALARSLEATLNNHIFCFENKSSRQKKGGAIGAGIALDVANIFMLWWDRQLKKKLQDEGIKVRMYSRYVDDINIVCEAIDMKVEREEADETTIKSIQKIAKKIHKSIQVTVDYPSNHENRRMPVLDLEQWIEQIEVDGEHKYQILHAHYVKKIASQRVISKESALSMQTKISILVSDLVR